MSKLDAWAKRDDQALTATFHVVASCVAIVASLSQAGISQSFRHGADKGGIHA